MVTLLFLPVVMACTTCITFSVPDTVIHFQNNNKYVTLQAGLPTGQNKQLDPDPRGPEGWLTVNLCGDMHLMSTIQINLEGFKAAQHFRLVLRPCQHVKSSFNTFCVSVDIMLTWCIFLNKFVF